jgi:WD40 repeat protein
MISGSIDTTSKMFMLNNATGRYDFDKENNYHSSFVYATAPSVNGSSFFTGGKDGKIFQIDLMGNPLNMLEGHESAVNSLSQCLPDELVSGSWDGTARIWDLETGKVKQVL